MAPLKGSGRKAPGLFMGSKSPCISSGSCISEQIALTNHSLNDVLTGSFSICALSSQVRMHYLGRKRLVSLRYILSGSTSRPRQVVEDILISAVWNFHAFTNVPFVTNL